MRPRQMRSSAKEAAKRKAEPQKPKGSVVRKATSEEGQPAGVKAPAKRRSPAPAPKR
jgi:hypothetical protein